MNNHVAQLEPIGRRGIHWLDTDHVTHEALPTARSSLALGLVQLWRKVTQRVATETAAVTMGVEVIANADFVGGGETCVEV